jgi:hypothetical protein
MTIAKLHGARERKRRDVGRRSNAERVHGLVALGKRLHRQKPKGGRMSPRPISAELAVEREWSAIRGRISHINSG